MRIESYIAKPSISKIGQISKNLLFVAGATTIGLASTQKCNLENPVNIIGVASAESRENLEKQFPEITQIINFCKERTNKFYLHEAENECERIKYVTEVLLILEMEKLKRKFRYQMETLTTSKNNTSYPTSNSRDFVLFEGKPFDLNSLNSNAELRASTLDCTYNLSINELETALGACEEIHEKIQNFLDQEILNINNKTTATINELQDAITNIETALEENKANLEKDKTEINDFLIIAIISLLVVLREYKDEIIAKFKAKS